MSQNAFQPKMSTAGGISVELGQLLTLYLCVLNYEHQLDDIWLKILFFKVTTDFRFRIGSVKLPEFTENHPIGLIML